jgi:hypothetical protein
MKRDKIWALRLACGHELHSRINPKYLLGPAYCDQPGCTLSPEFAVQRSIVAVRRLSRRERRALSA